MRNVNAILLILFSAMSCTKPAEKSPVDWVDTQLGATHCRWFFYTPAALPFGMVKLAPTTNAYGSAGSWLPNGYDDRHTSIEGFAHLHEFQIGGIVTIPTIGELKTLPGTLDNPDSGYRSRFEKSTEQAAPGFMESHWPIMVSKWSLQLPNGLVFIGILIRKRIQHESYLT